MDYPIVLASTSPRRKQLLSNFIEDLRIVGSPYEERLDPDGAPEIEVMRAALMKGLLVLPGLEPNGLVISADTIVHHGRILGKPKDAGEAGEMLRDLSGKWHSVYTGVALIEPGSGRKVVDVVHTRVKFNPLEEALIDWYVASGEPLDKAGAYGIQDLGALLVEEIRGDYFNVVGLPVSRIHALMTRYFDRRLY